MVKTEFCSFAPLFHASSDARAKKAVPLPGWEQQVRAMVGPIPS